MLVEYVDGKPVRIVHHLYCNDCGAYYRGAPNDCPHCQDGMMR